MLGKSHKKAGKEGKRLHERDFGEEYSDHELAWLAFARAAALNAER